MTREEQSHGMKLAQEGQVVESRCVWPHLQGGGGKNPESWVQPQHAPELLQTVGGCPLGPTLLIQSSILFSYSRRDK